jgi:hypothetical protein
MAVRMFSNYRIFSTLVIYIPSFFLLQPYFFAMLNLSSIAWNLGCGFAQNANQLIAFRFLSGIGGSAPLAVRIIPPPPLYDDISDKVLDPFLLLLLLLL